VTRFRRDFRICNWLRKHKTGVNNMTWQVTIYDKETSENKANVSLLNFASVCDWIKTADLQGQSVTIHVVAPQDATVDEVQELRRLGVRLSFIG
jgi:hypothetical protein